MSRTDDLMRALNACPCCGAHRWTPDWHEGLGGSVVCGECGHASTIEELTPVAVGRD